MRNTPQPGGWLMASSSFREGGIIPIDVEHVRDINHILPEKETVGRFRTAIVGYNASPSLIEVVGYVVYLATALGLYLRLGARNTSRVAEGQLTR